MAVDRDISTALTASLHQMMGSKLFPQRSSMVPRTWSPAVMFLDRRDIHASGISTRLSLLMFSGMTEDL